MNKSLLERIKSNPAVYADFKAWMEHECEGEEEDELHAEEYSEILQVFNPLNIKF